jgi:hypothetical protein
MDVVGALAVLLLIYFYAHYAFASITAHATAMFTPFVVVTMGAVRRSRWRDGAGRVLEPERVTHALWHHACADLFRGAVRTADAIGGGSASSAR